MVKKINPGDIAWGVIGAVALTYEAWALFANKEPGDTLSEAVWNSVSHRPYIPFFCGFLAGHFFWQRENVYNDNPPIE